MFLTNIKVTNFKSLEDTEMPKIGKIDILAGKNNSGKSSIFQIINLIVKTCNSNNYALPDLPDNWITGKDPKKEMSISLIFSLKKDEKERFLRENGASKQIIEKLVDTKFMNELQFTFVSEPANKVLYLNSVAITGTDDLFGEVILKIKDDYSVAKFVSIINSGNPNLRGALISSGDFRFTSRNLHRQEALSIMALIEDWAEKVVYFSAHRQSDPVQEAKINHLLAEDGKNLAQIVFSIRNDDGPEWVSLRKFVSKMAQGVGTLQAKMDDNRQVKIEFKDPKFNVPINLKELGAGIEQLIIMAYVLISDKQDSFIMIDCPEHHLHPGAQRVLLQFLQENCKDSQILISTHSPVFLSKWDISIHIVTKSEKGTKIKVVEEPNDLSITLSELGCRNSDIIQADIIAFVEGPSDELILIEWANKLGLDFELYNTKCIQIGGSRNLNYYANSDVLEKISKLEIPYYFILDRDEKSQETVIKLQSRISTLITLERREIENYLLNAEWILNALRLRVAGLNNKEINNLTVEKIDQQIKEFAAKSKRRVLIKRIKTEIGGGTFLSDENAEQLISETQEDKINSLSCKICEAISQTINQTCNKQKIREIVNNEAVSVEQLFDRNDELLKIAPGEEILTSIYHAYGFKFDKKKDGLTIARQAKPEQIPPEISNIIKKVVNNKNEQPAVLEDV